MVSVGKTPSLSYALNFLSIYLTRVCHGLTCAWAQTYVFSISQTEQRRYAQWRCPKEQKCCKNTWSVEAQNMTTGDLDELRGFQHSYKAIYICFQLLWLCETLKDLPVSYFYLFIFPIRRIKHQRYHETLKEMYGSSVNLTNYYILTP